MPKSIMSAAQDRRFAQGLAGVQADAVARLAQARSAAADALTQLRAGAAGARQSLGHAGYDQALRDATSAFEAADAAYKREVFDADLRAGR